MAPSYSDNEHISAAELPLLVADARFTATSVRNPDNHRIANIRPDIWLRHRLSHCTTVTHRTDWSKEHSQQK